MFAHDTYCGACVGARSYIENVVTFHVKAVTAAMLDYVSILCWLYRFLSLLSINSLRDKVSILCLTKHRFCESMGFIPVNINIISIARNKRLFSTWPCAATGSTSGTVEVWDPRSRQQAGILDVRGVAPHRQGAEVSALRYHQGLWCLLLVFLFVSNGLWVIYI